MLILLKPTKAGENSQYSFRELYNLSDYRVDTSFGRKTIGRNSSYKFQILLARISQSSAFTLYLKTEEEQTLWMKTLQDAM